MSSHRPKNGVSAPARRPVVLVADDDATTREMLAAMLRTNGYDVELAAGGQEALERVGRGGVDLVLLDALMPRVSGMEACRVLKGTPRDDFLPVVMATLSTDPASRAEGLRMGADEHVSKPFEEVDVLARLAAMMRLKAAHDEVRTARAIFERMSAHDELTGALRYRHLYARLADEFRRSERQHEPIAACLLDVDGLKAHNDRGGRGVGDGILCAIVDAIRRSMRDVDVVARYGGDEFIVLLPVTHLAGSLAAAERIWREGGARASVASGVSMRVTTSIGVAMYPGPDVRTKDALIKAADLALAQAKREGGNRVCVFQQYGVIYTPDLSSRRPARGIARKENA